MRITCPACAADYEVPPDRVSPGRNVRCAKCGVKWAPVPAATPQPVALEPGTLEPAATPEPTAAVPVPSPVVNAPEPASPEALAQRLPTLVGTIAELPEAQIGHIPPAQAPLAPPSPPARGARIGLMLAWLITIAALGSAGYGAVAYRAAVMKAWPPSARAYAWAGLGG